MKLRKPKQLRTEYPRDRIDWGYVTLRREGDGLDDKEQDVIEIDTEDATPEDIEEDELSNQ
jgi:hypothetical protein